MKFTAQEIATIIEGSIEGNPNIQVNSISKIEEGTKGDISFLANKKYTKSPTTTGGIPINELRTIKIKLLNGKFFRAI